MISERFKSFVSLEKQLWKDTFRNHPGYCVSLMMHPAFGLIDATTTNIGINAGISETNFLPKLIIDNLGVETFSLTRIAVGVGTAFLIEKYFHREGSLQMATWTSNLAHTSNVWMVLNNIPALLRQINL